MVVVERLVPMAVILLLNKTRCFIDKTLSTLTFPACLVSTKPFFHLGTVGTALAGWTTNSKFSATSKEFFRIH